MAVVAATIAVHKKAAFPMAWDHHSASFFWVAAKFKKFKVRVSSFHENE